MTLHPSMTALVFLLAISTGFGAEDKPSTTSMMSLDGQWSLAVDPQNVGRQERWFEKQTCEGAKPGKVPWILQSTFPGYHGVAWYARDFVAPPRPQPGWQCLLRFQQVDYLADVWLNGVHIGGHEGGETTFALDATGAVKPGEKNFISVRVLNPTTEPIDGIRLDQTARRCKVVPFAAGAIFNHGGITGPVELAWAPQIRVEDLFVIAEPAGDQGKLHLRTTVHNAGSQAGKGALEFTLASARGGETTSALRLAREFAPGSTTVETELTVNNPHLWDLNAPYLYRVTARATVDGADAFDERSTRCGFRDFCFADGYFRLNGRRIYLRCSHTCNHYPVGIQFPEDPDLLRRDMLNMKVMGFNAIRFIWGGATPVQLDLCDEIGLLVYEESYASMPIADSPQMAQRFDAAVGELIRRDRNHPSVVIWGLLNEANDRPTFRHAAAMLPLVRSLDPSRMVMLNSGRWDQRTDYGIRTVPGIRVWPKDRPTEPWVGINVTTETVRGLGITWPAGHLALHPGPAQEWSVVRWTAPTAGPAEVSGTFVGLAGQATTDVHVRHNGRAIFDSHVNLNGSPNEVRFNKGIDAAAGDTVDFVVGVGNGNYGGDTTGLCATIAAAGRTYDATDQFSMESNPNGPWSYGSMAAGAAEFALYSADKAGPAVGSLANPGCLAWEDVLKDVHSYPRVPHTASVLESLRTMEGNGQPVFLTEYGIGSAVDLWRAVRHFEQRGADGLEDAEFFREKLGQFETDWRQWRMDEAFARPEDFFMESLKKMAGQRTLGLNAIRSNPKIISHSLTGAIDHVMCGEGLTTLFRELKPGTIDAMYDAWAPLRWCLFAEPAHIARGGKIRLEAVLADEDVLKPGEYPARLQVIGPDLTRALDRRVSVTVPKRTGQEDPPLARLCFADDVAIDGPPGKYCFLAAFERGAAATGTAAEFYVTDLAEMPPVEAEVVLWGDDPGLVQWLTAHGIHTRSFSAGPSVGEGLGVRASGGATLLNRELILASSKPPAPGGPSVFAELARRIAAGSSVVFLSPEVFANGGQSTAWLPLARKGALGPIRGWLYLKDEWAKRHPIFEGLHAGGLMDYTYYRELIPDLVWTGQDAPAEAVAGAIKASQDYASGLMVAVYALGEGRFVLNTLQIRENLQTHPAAERLLRNMLRYAAPNTSRPAAALPDDFDKQLATMGLN
ncbi:MAG: glycoside hydrolase family 2 [Pirellulales bacterium]|nr:glycoside hydrolase family 2 [Pirellulales bacterium]